MAYLTPAMQELRAALTEADKISQRSSLDAASSARLSFLLAKIKTLNSNSLPTSGEETRAFFRALLTNKEVRADVPMQEGTQSITYTEGTGGGTLVNQEFYDEIIHGLAQVSPLLDPDVVTLIQSKDFSLKPYTIPGLDLTTYSATQINEGGIQYGAGIAGGVPLPQAFSVIQGGHKYKASWAVTTEQEQDNFEPMVKTIGDAFKVGFGRALGTALVSGNGSTQPQGVLNYASAPVYTTQNTGKLVLDDFLAVYFSVNRIHRAQPKAAWLMSDSAYLLARQATDTVGNPLLHISKDDETILGKPVYVCPDLPEYNASLGTQAAGSFAIFGDLSHMYVRVSQLIVKRQWQNAGFVEKGQVSYTGYLRSDCKIFDPSAGVAVPLVSAALKS